MLSLRCITASLLAAPILTAMGGESVPSFRHEVMPIFAKAGCSMGACHGSASGKGNLKLSLRGESPLLDHATLTQNRNSKRLNVDDPAASFLLRKPSLDGVEHEGGRRFERGSEAWQILHDWAAAGAPMDPDTAPRLTRLTVSPVEATVVEPVRAIPLTVMAEFSDGSRRDVSRWSVYEPSNLLPEVSAGGIVRVSQPGETTVVVRFEDQQTPVRLTFLPDRPGFQWQDTPEANFIDHHVFAKLRRTVTHPSPLCSDAVFLRRAWLDITGTIPPPEEARKFLADPASDKRTRLVDALLERPEFAAHWALQWADVLRVEERVLDSTGVAAFHAWIQSCVATDRPLDAFVRDILTATGSTYQNPPANFYRAQRDPVLRSEAVAQVFLGTRLGCAKCHRHPYEHWTQDDYYGFAALFDGMRYDVKENKRKDTNDQGEFIGEQVILLDGKRELTDPRSKKAPAPALLGAAQEVNPQTALTDLAAWMTAPEHPLFARVQAHRIWAKLMGRGLVEPVDDFRQTNPPSNPALLDALTDHFVRNGMRLKPMIRLICQSRAWQLSSIPDETNAADTLNYSHALVRRLPAESLLDALHNALGVAPEFAAYPDVRRAADIPGVQFRKRRSEPTADDTFLAQFGKSARATACECERTSDSSLSQVFLLTSGPGMTTLLRDPANALTALSDPAMPPQAALTSLFWQILSRPPTAAEASRLTPLLKDTGTRRESLEDLAWSLVNAKEFLLRN